MNHIEGLKKFEKKGLTKEQKEELAIAERVLEWLEAGKDIRCLPAESSQDLLACTLNASSAIQWCQSGNSI